MKKIVLKWVIIEIENNRVTPVFNGNELSGLYFKKLKGTVSKKYISDEAWEYAVKHFGAG
jgi:hypothetical protein